MRAIVIRGEIIETPGPSDDSVSLALDSGLAIIGDLHAPGLTPHESREIARQGWQKQLQMVVLTVYPSHGVPFRINSLQSNPNFW